jgi:ABC-type nitrate/sulfonate/bicarbonate transport system permease component
MTHPSGKSMAPAADDAAFVVATRPHTSFLRRHESLILGGGTLLVLGLIWEACWQAGLISPLFFSGPSAIARKFVELTLSGELARNAAYSGTNYFIGFALALVVAVPLGIVVGWYRRLLLALDPLITGLYAMPRIALYPLIVIWFGIGSGSKIFVVFLSAMLPILVNTIAGVRNIDADLLKAARAFCATDRQIFMTVALPSSVPFILTGVRQGVAHGLIGVIIAELSAGSEGIGYMIAYAGQMFATDTLMVGVLTTAAAGMLITWIAGRIQSHFERWRPTRPGEQ